MMNLNLTANILGILSLASAIVAFSPTFTELLKITSKYKRTIWKVARFALMLTVCMGLSHGLMMTQKDNIDFNNINTYWVYAGGLFTFNLFAFLAFVFTELRSDIKKLSYFSYGALFLLACHIGQHILPSF